MTTNVLQLPNYNLQVRDYMNQHVVPLMRRGYLVNILLLELATNGNFWSDPAEDIWLLSTYNPEKEHDRELIWDIARLTSFDGMAETTHQLLGIIRENLHQLHASKIDKIMITNDETMLTFAQMDAGTRKVWLLDVTEEAIMELILKL